MSLTDWLILWQYNKKTDFKGDTSAAQLQQKPKCFPSTLDVYSEGLMSSFMEKVIKPQQERKNDSLSWFTCISAFTGGDATPVTF